MVAGAIGEDADSWIGCRACSQIEPGCSGFIEPTKRDGVARVMLPEMLVGCVLEMVTGSSLTPKGGLGKLVKALEANEELPKPKGVYGDGAFASEPWGLTAIRKRVGAARKFYARFLSKEENPGYSSLLGGTVASIALLIGEGAVHVSDAL
jgi:hypothetical protein